MHNRRIVIAPSLKGFGRAWLLGALLVLVLGVSSSSAQTLSAKWEELTAQDFVKAMEQSKGVCLLPFGILEKHGPAGPLGTDLINVRYVSTLAARQEYVLIFPEYYIGQIFEAKHQPGTIAYSRQLQMEALQETVDEMARNGCRKIIINNGHGGNNALLQYFAQVQLEKRRDYVVYTYMGQIGGPEGGWTGAAAPSKAGADGHGGESELANVMASHPELAHPERSPEESPENLRRLAALPKGLSTGIGWYANFPNHYAGDSSGATAARGVAVTRILAEKLAEAIAAVKADEISPKLQKEFFEASEHPLQTKQ
jgi:creatinine amidohydrolase